MFGKIVKLQCKFQSIQIMISWYQLCHVFRGFIGKKDFCLLRNVAYHDRV